MVEMIGGVLGNLCPKCHHGKVFSKIMKMNELCPACGFKFERESGYFAGSMVLSYFLGFIVTLPTFLFLLFRDLPLYVIVGVPSLMAMLCCPVVFRFSRLIWMYFDHRTERHS